MNRKKNREMGDGVACIGSKYSFCTNVICLNLFNHWIAVACGDVDGRLVRFCIEI